MRLQHGPKPKDSLVDIKTICLALYRSRASIYCDIQRADFLLTVLSLEKTTSTRNLANLRTQICPFAPADLGPAGLGSGV